MDLAQVSFQQQQLDAALAEQARQRRFLCAQLAVNAAGHMPKRNITVEILDLARKLDEFVAETPVPTVSQTNE